jgi:hypothetical protein
MAKRKWSIKGLLPRGSWLGLTVTPRRAKAAKRENARHPRRRRLAVRRSR